MPSLHLSNKRKNDSCHHPAGGDFKKAGTSTRGFVRSEREAYRRDFMIVKFPFQKGSLYQSVGRLIGVAFLLASSPLASADTLEISVTFGSDSHFDPKFPTIHAGDTVKWVWADNAPHQVVSGQGQGEHPDGLFDSGVHQAPFTYSVTFNTTGKFPYYCGVHAHLNQGDTFPFITVVSAKQPSTGMLNNISTRLPVGTGDNALIGGFVVGGSGKKDLLVRGLGPTLGQFGVSGFLQNPTLELRDSAQHLLAANDDWAQAANADSIPTGLRPPNSVEPAILASVDPGSYTAIVRGLNDTTGIALVEVYDLAPGADAHLNNISTRGFVQTGDNVMIAGVSVQAGNENVLVRGLGPTLASFGVPNALSDPTLELHNPNGALLAANDNWKSAQQSEIQATGYAPPNDAEAAILIGLAPGTYTAIAGGKNNTTGVALVEVYTLP